MAKHARPRKIFWGYVSLFLLWLILACWPHASTSTGELKVGIISGHSEDVLKVAQQVAWQQYHLKLKIVTFDDYVLPNLALDHGEIDANIFQHIPYLNAQIQARGLHLTPLAKTFVYPMGFFSRKIQHLSELPIGAVVAIPNDPSNEARSLLLLQKVGLIQLRTGVSLLATVNDIVSNPKQLKLITLDAAQLPRVFQDATLVALTNDYIASAGYTLSQSLFKEGPDSLYANIIAVRTSDHRPELNELVLVMHSKPVLEETQKIYPGGAAIAAW